MTSHHLAEYYVIALQGTPFTRWFGGHVMCGHCGAERKRRVRLQDHKPHCFYFNAYQWAKRERPELLRHDHLPLKPSEIERPKLTLGPAR